MGGQVVGIMDEVGAPHRVGANACTKRMVLVVYISF